MAGKQSLMQSITQDSWKESVCNILLECGDISIKEEPVPTNVVLGFACIALSEFVANYDIDAKAERTEAMDAVLKQIREVRKTFQDALKKAKKEQEKAEKEATKQEAIESKAAPEGQKRGAKHATGD